MQSSPWKVLEAIPGLVAMTDVWESHLGEHFAPFKALCLRPSTRLADAVPCANQCGCYHRVIQRHDGTGAIAICTCDPPACPDFDLTIADITPLEVHRQKLARALARALDLQPKVETLSLKYTLQLGSWSTSATPAILTMQTEHEPFRQVIAELAATTRRPFILLAPTTAHMTVPCQQLITSASSAFFSMEATVVLEKDSTLRAIRPPSEIFAQFAPPLEIRTPQSSSATPHPTGFIPFYFWALGIMLIQGSRLLEPNPTELARTPWTGF